MGVLFGSQKAEKKNLIRGNKHQGSRFGTDPNGNKHQGSRFGTDLNGNKHQGSRFGTDLHEISTRVRGLGLILIEISTRVRGLATPEGAGTNYGNCFVVFEMREYIVKHNT